MDTIFDILTGIGLALAAGIPPVLPGLAAGAMASANALIDFDHTDLSFLESPGWLLALVVALIVVVLLQRRGETSTLASIVAGLGVGVGALLFAGALADHGDVWWPGIIGGILCALLAEAASRDVFTRARARLDADARGTLFVYADGMSLIVAVLAILVPPLSIVALGFLAWLLI